MRATFEQGIRGTTVGGIEVLLPDHFNPTSRKEFPARKVANGSRCRVAVDHRTNTLVIV